MSSTYIPVSLHSGAVSDRACSTCTRNRRHSVYRDSPPVDEGGLGVPGNDSGSDRGAIEGSGPRAGVATVHVVGQWPGSSKGCLLYTSDAADDLLCVDLGGRRII